MWKREETPRPATVPVSPAPMESQPSMVSRGINQNGEGQRPMRNESMSIGKSIVIKGEVSGGEDLTIEGQVEGRIQLRDHVLTVGGSAHVQAHVVAKSIIVLGHVTGDLTAHEKVEIREQGSVEGDIVVETTTFPAGES